MDEDWDLHALVRSCKTSPTTTITISAAAAETDSSKTREDPFGSLAILINHEEDNNNPFHFPNLLSDPKTKYNPFEELQQLYKPFFPTTTAAAITAPLMKPPPPRLPLPLPPSPFVSELTNNGGILDRNPRAGPSGPSSSSSSLSFGPRSRRRKNQQKKVVKQVTAESLSSDMWAWRKYGQKPIKGSPYPRNYYRCSSSKGCPARKQVERSNSDPNMFNITYTGEHTHPRPTHRNSLAGSTRNKYPSAATATATADDDNNKNNNPENPSRFASSSLSPTTPLLIPPIMDFEVGMETNNDNDDDDDADVDGGDDEDEEMNGADQTVDDDDADEEERNILIPNLAMNEDIFMGLQELTDHGLKTGIKSQPSKFNHRLSAAVVAVAGKTNTISAARSGGC